MPVRLEEGEAVGDLCFTADVFHADTQVVPDRVRVVIEPGGSPQEATLRIRSAAVVDEPVVTIYLKSECSQKLSRRYVLLSEVPTALSESGRNPGMTVAGRTVTSEAPTLPSTGTAVASDAGPVSTPDRAGGGTASSGAAPVATRTRPGTSPALAPSRPPSVVRKKPTAEVARPRLRLDPLEFAPERDPALKSTAELLTTPLDNDPKRAAAAALWRAINAQPTDVLRDAQRLQDLERDLKALRDQTLRAQTGIADLRSQLQQSETQRYANGLVYALMAMLVLALAVAGYLWNRLRRGASAVWWQPAAESASAPLGPATRTQGTQFSAPAELRPGADGLDLDLGVEESRFETRHPAPVSPLHAWSAGSSRLETSDFASSFGGSARAVNTEELFDIQQQADFFVSLGQFDQAIAVLRNHILENPDTSALAYLDLFDIYHQLGNREEYALLREDFNRVFNAEVPTFDEYHQESKGLESYTVAMSRIEALWPSSKVLGVIEESIFRKPGAGDEEAFDPQAYRELLLLHAIAKSVIEPGPDVPEFVLSDPHVHAPTVGTDSSPPSFSQTKVQPLSTVDKVLACRDLDRSVPRPSPRIGIDIDLSDDAAEGDAGARGTSVDLDLSLEAPPVSGANLIDFDFDFDFEEGVSADAGAPKSGKQV